MSLNQTSFSESDALDLQRQLSSSRGKILDDLKVLKGRWSALKSVWHDRNRQSFELRIEQLFLRWEKALTALECYSGSVGEHVKISASLTEINSLLNNSLSGSSQAQSGMSQAGRQTQVISSSPTTGEVNPATSEGGGGEQPISNEQALLNQVHSILNECVQMLWTKGSTCLNVFVIAQGLMIGYLAPAFIPQLPASNLDSASASASNNQATQCSLSNASESNSDTELIQETTKVLGDLDGYVETKSRQRKNKDDNDTQDAAQKKNEESGAAGEA